MWEPIHPILDPNWAGLAVLFSRQLLDGSHDFFVRFNILILIYLFKYKTIETHARAFLQLNISAVGSVQYVLQQIYLTVNLVLSSFFALIHLTRESKKVWRTKKEFNSVWVQPIILNRIKIDIRSSRYRKVANSSRYVRIVQNKKNLL